MGLSQTTVVRIWRAFGLQPRRSETCKRSTDPRFVDRMRDIVGLHLAPPVRALPVRALVLCVDEEPSIQAPEGTAPVRPRQPGQPERRHTHDDLRHGTTDLVAALDVASGRVIGEVHRRHCSQEFRAFLDTIDRNTPPDLDLHLTLDNAATHARGVAQTALIKTWRLQRPRVHLHVTPTSSSWINLVACWFGIFRHLAAARPGARSVPRHGRAGGAPPRLRRRQHRRPEAVRLAQSRR